MNIALQLSNHVPEAALTYCVSLHKKYLFELKITKKRVTKAGDYRFDPKLRSHTISVNNNLNKYAFLITYVHEVAHRVVMDIYGRSVKPHGIEWKTHFQQLMLPVLNPDIFPDDVLRALSNYLRNPKASSYSDIRLSNSLRNYDSRNNESELSLNDIQEGHKFEFNKRIFEKILTKRTRVLCIEVKSGRRYLIPALAMVNVLDG